MANYTVISDGVLTGTIADEPHAVRLAWLAVLFEADRLRGKVKLPVRVLARKAAISVDEAIHALEVLQRPDPYSSSKAHEGRRLLPIEGEEDWYLVTTWEKHAAERERFFHQLRQQRYRARKRNEEENEE